MVPAVMRSRPAAVIFLAVCCGTLLLLLSRSQHLLLGRAGVATASRTLFGPATAPPPSSAAALVFGVIGDWGVARLPWEASGAQVPFQLAVAAAMGRWSTVQPRPAFVLSVGDHAYPVGLRSANESGRLVDSWERVYVGGTLKMLPWYATGGNHDCVGDMQAQYRFPHPRWHMSPYAAVRRHVPGSRHGTSVRVIILDMCTFICGGGAPPNFRCKASAKDNMGEVRGGDEAARSAMLQWAREQLEISGCGRHSRTWCVVAGHWPIFSFAGNGPTEVLISDLLPLLRQHGVHAYFSGHDHNLQHVSLRQSDSAPGVGGAPNPTSTGGPEMFVSGAGGYKLHSEMKAEVAVEARQLQSQMATSRYIHHGHGFLSVKASDEEMVVSLVAVDGQGMDASRATVVHTATLNW